MEKPVNGNLEDCREELEIFHHACEIGNYQKAYWIYDAIDDFLDKRGFWGKRVNLLETLVKQWGHQEDNRQEIAYCCCYLGNTYYSLGKYDCAIEFYEQWNEIAREISDRNGEARSLGNLGNAYYSLGQYQRAIDFHQQSIEIAREIGNRRGIGVSLCNMANTQAKLDNHGQALLNFQQAKLIYEDLKLDHMVEQCNEALRNCNQIIAAERRSPPAIDQAPKESTIEWYKRQKQANQPIVTSAEDDRKMNRIFYFCVGLAICFVVWKVKN